MKIEIEHIAKVAYEAIRALSQIQGDYTLKGWDGLTPEARKPVIDRVMFRLEHRRDPISALHDQWQLQQLKAGWKWGTVKNVAAKEDPRIVPFTTLPIEEQRKEMLFVSIVEAMTSL